MMTLDEKLIHLRKEKGMTQLELAEAVEVSRQAVSKWESGSALPSTEKLRSLSELYGVSADYLLNEGKQEVEKIAPLPQEAEDDLKIPSREKRKIAVKWTAVVLVILFGVITIGMTIVNRDREHLRLEEEQGEEVTDVPRIEFDLKW